MEAGALLASAALVALGVVLTLASEAWRRRWSNKDAAAAALRQQEADRLRRMEERAEAAANELLVILDNMLDLLRDVWGHGVDVDVGQLPADMRRLAVALGDSTVRDRIERIALVLENLDTVDQWAGVVPGSAARGLHAVGRNALGHVLSGEPLEDDAALRKYMSAIDDYWEMQRESYEDEKRERQAQSEQGTVG